MNTDNTNTSLVDNYFTLLKHLTPDHKLELISRLSESMKTMKKEETAVKENDDSWKSLFGSWKLDQSADEFIDDLRKDRNFSRKEVEL